MPLGTLSMREPDGIVRRGSESLVGSEIQGPKAIPAPKAALCSQAAHPGPASLSKSPSPSRLSWGDTLQLNAASHSLSQAHGAESGPRDEANRANHRTWEGEPSVGQSIPEGSRERRPLGDADVRVYSPDSDASCLGSRTTFSKILTSPYLSFPICRAVAGHSAYLM